MYDQQAKTAKTSKTKAPAAPLPVPLLRLPVVVRCCNVFNVTRALFLERGETEDYAMTVARNFYRAAMPAPIDLESTRDLIACITYGVSIGVFEFKEATALYYGAQVAHGVNRSAAEKSKKA